MDSSVHLFEKWGLPIWKDEKGSYVHEGRWQLMINGESYKVIVAEAAKNALDAAGGEYLRAHLHRRLPSWTVTGSPARSASATREEKFYVFKAKAVILRGHGRRGARLQAAVHR